MTHSGGHLGKSTREGEGGGGAKAPQKIFWGGGGGVYSEQYSILKG